MSDNTLDVAYIAKLAKLELSEDETLRFSKDLNRILSYIEQLNKWDVEGVEPMYHPLPLIDVMRADEATPCLSNAAAMNNAPDSKDGQILVPKVVESAH